MMSRRKYEETTACYSRVPHSGLLSLVLFNIYTCDSPSAIISTGAKIAAFADDIKTYYAIKELADFQAVQRAVEVADQ
ncbi:hypothetical protein ANCDUO_01133 [Ancylostoma duodenale]|uniref:Reverse transcriptase domain-containing protein n=1 Tax=Ancylostoma duodenale TaxID=51022 RepID=A0A0C2HA50_9BILA|nr:hypothetical protein ANCDUO_01133 [Ancylostoma duodenale]